MKRSTNKFELGLFFSCASLAHPLLPLFVPVPSFLQKKKKKKWTAIFHSLRTRFAETENLSTVIGNEALITSVYRVSLFFLFFFLKLFSLFFFFFFFFFTESFRRKQGAERDPPSIRGIFPSLVIAGVGRSVVAVCLPDDDDLFIYLFFGGVFFFPFFLFPPPPPPPPLPLAALLMKTFRVATGRCRKGNRQLGAQY